MKSTFITIFTILISLVHSQAQQVHIIKFISEGDESKPTGTVIISVEKVMPLTDRPTDATFGKSIKTDIKTFKIIRKLIKNVQYRTALPTELDSKHFLRIEDSDGFVLNLTDSKLQLFFDDLRSTIQRRHGDVMVIDLFKYYY